MTVRAAFETEFTATLGDLVEPRPEPPIEEPLGDGIHSERGAREYGFSGPLVIGVKLYARCLPLILEACGEEWLDHGWLDYRLRKPTFPGTRLRLRLEREDDHYRLELRQRPGDVCLTGSAGLGAAPWLDELRTPQPAAPLPAHEPPEPLSLVNARIGSPFRPLAVDIGARETSAFAAQYPRTPHLAAFTQDVPVIHPVLAVSQMVYLLEHTYKVGPENPTMAVGERIQNLRRPRANQPYALTGELADVFERKGHHFVAYDAVLSGADGVEYTRFRHVTVFKIRRGSET